MAPARANIRASYTRDFNKPLTMRGLVDMAPRGAQGCIAP